MYNLVFTKQAQKDAKYLSESNLKKKAEEILKIFKSEPFSDYLPYDKLIGDLTGSFSRRVNIQYRRVYQVM